MRGKTSSLPKVLTSRLGFQEEAVISWLRGWKESGAKQTNTEGPRQGAEGTDIATRLAAQDMADSKGGEGIKGRVTAGPPMRLSFFF